jgi:hypothetical protein
MVRTWTAFIWLRVGTSGSDNGSPGFINIRKFHDY